VGAGDVVANFAITQVSNRGLDLFSQSQTHLVADLSGWFSGPSAVATLAPPTNTPPAAPQVSFSGCTTSGLSTLNATRASVGVGALALNTAAQNFACSWASQLSSDPSVFAHSTNAARDAAVGCPTGENIASASGASSSTVMSLWLNSPAHLTNLENSIYHGAGLAFVVRTDANGSQATYGVTVFATC
jgi:uncharacterized protein YkwD